MNKKRPINLSYIPYEVKGFEKKCPSLGLTNKQPHHLDMPARTAVSLPMMPDP